MGPQAQITTARCTAAAQTLGAFDLEVLQLTEGGTLALAGFTGSWNGLMVGLQLVGDQRTSLEDYRTQGLLAIIGSPADVTIAYDLETDTTYVAVPAPGTLLVVALTGIVGLRGRPARRRN